MNDGTPLTLAARQIYAVPDAAAVRIVCTAGALWLTLDRDPRDIILRAGESFEEAEPRRALLYALEPSGFRIQAQPQGSSRRRLAKNSSDCSRSPSVWAATRAVTSG
jgi:hypothetical protein